MPEELAGAAGIDIVQAAALCCIQCCVELLLNWLWHCTPAWAFALQRRDLHRTTAVGVCADEVEHVLLAFHELISKYIKHPTYVLDKPRIHTAVRWHQFQGGPNPLTPAPQPRCSPDFNRPAEHYIEAVKRDFKTELLRRDVRQPPECYMNMIESICTTCYTRDAANRDILTLPALWQHVSTPRPAGSGGDWPPAEFR
jgi:hypothetical protein